MQKLTVLDFDFRLICIPRHKLGDENIEIFLFGFIGKPNCTFKYELECEQSTILAHVYY
jgi:hypothetical protein